MIADAYGGNEAEEVNARTGCVGCPLAQNDTALETVMAMPRWAHLAPLMGLKPLYRWLREPAQRLRKAGAEILKSGAMAANPQRMGPLTLEARLTALETILAIQEQINAKASARDARYSLIDAEEEVRIRELINAETWPDGWAGDEPHADAWLAVQVFGNGAEQHALFSAEEMA